MRCVFLGLVFFSLMACSGAFAGEALTANPNPGGSPAKPSSPGQPHHPKNNKRVFSVQRPLPLSSAAAYASEHATALPNSSTAGPPPSSNIWTGFYVGAGAGAAQR